MLVQLENIFGEDFWKNVVLEFTRYGFSDEELIERADDLPLNSENERKLEMNRMLKGYFGFQVRPINWKHFQTLWLIVRLNFQNDLPAVFIDSYYNQHHQGSKDKFDEYMTKLWNYADNMTPRNVSDIKAVQNELAIKNQQLVHLANELNICNGKKS